MAKKTQAKYGRDIVLAVQQWTVEQIDLQIDASERECEEVIATRTREVDAIKAEIDALKLVREARQILTVTPVAQQRPSLLSMSDPVVVDCPLPRERVPDAFMDAQPNDVETVAFTLPSVPAPPLPDKPRPVNGSSVTNRIASAAPAIKPIDPEVIYRFLKTTGAQAVAVIAARCKLTRPEVEQAVKGDRRFKVSAHTGLVHVATSPTLKARPNSNGRKPSPKRLAEMLAVFLEAAGPSDVDTILRNVAELSASALHSIVSRDGLFHESGTGLICLKLHVSPG